MTDWLTVVTPLDLGPNCQNALFGEERTFPDVVGTWVTSPQFPLSSLALTSIRTGPSSVSDLFGGDQEIDFFSFATPPVTSSVGVIGQWPDSPQKSPGKEDTAANTVQTLFAHSNQNLVSSEAETQYSPTRPSPVSPSPPAPLQCPPQMPPPQLPVSPEFPPFADSGAGIEDSVGTVSSTIARSYPLSTPPSSQPIAKTLSLSPPEKVPVSSPPQNTSTQFNPLPPVSSSSGSLPFQKISFPPAPPPLKIQLAPQSPPLVSPSASINANPVFHPVDLPPRPIFTPTFSSVSAPPPLVTHDEEDNVSGIKDESKNEMEETMNKSIESVPTEPKPMTIDETETLREAYEVISQFFTFLLISRLWKRRKLRQILTVWTWRMKSLP